MESDPLVSKLMSETGGGIRANLRGGASVAGIVDFRGVGPIDIEWRLQGSLPTTVEGGVMGKLIQM